MGLNWQILTNSEQRVVWQDGIVPGFSSRCVVEPERAIGLAILTNESDRDSARALTRMANSILRELDPAAVLFP